MICKAFAPRMSLKEIGTAFAVSCRILLAGALASVRSFLLLGLARWLITLGIVAIGAVAWGRGCI